MERDAHGTVAYTHRTDTGMFLIFNGYGTLSGYIGARLLSQAVGATYRKLERLHFRHIYVNKRDGLHNLCDYGIGYLVAPEAVCAQVGKVDMLIEVAWGHAAEAPVEKVA